MCTRGTGGGQIFGLFKGKYFIDRLLEQNVIKQKLRYNVCNTVTSSRSTNYIRQCHQTVFPMQIQKRRKSNFYFPRTILKQFGHRFIYFGSTQLWCLYQRFHKLLSLTKIYFLVMIIDRLLIIDTFSMFLSFCYC